MQDHKTFAIIGNPLGHSKSPLLHNAFFTYLQYPAKYELFALTPEELGYFMRTMRQKSIQGLSVTIPHKEAVMPYLDDISPLARSVGAVNTIYLQDGFLYGDNTDVEGFLLPLRSRKVPFRAMVLGAGGAARAVIVGLKTLRSAGMEKIFVSARSAEKAQALCEEFSCVYVPWEERSNIKAPWLINTTPLGMQGALEQESPYAAKALLNTAGKASLAYDLVYNPAQTRFLQEAAEAGWETQNGLDMFLGQAIGQQKLWLKDLAAPLEGEACMEKMRQLLCESLR